MAFKFHVQRHYPRIGEMTVSLGDPWADNALSVVVPEGFTSEECQASLRTAKLRLAVELRQLASDIETSANVQKERP